MNTERDELAAVITKAYVEKNEGARYTGEHAPVDEPIADAILAAGYRKPRTITTAEELDALPVGAIVYGRMLAQKWVEPEGEVWHVAGKGMPWSITQMVKFGTLPTTVLWEPR